MVQSAFVEVGSMTVIAVPSQAVVSFLDLRGLIVLNSAHFGAFVVLFETCVFSNSSAHWRRPPPVRDPLWFSTRTRALGYKTMRGLGPVLGGTVGWNYGGSEAEYGQGDTGVHTYPVEACSCLAEDLPIVSAESGQLSTFGVTHNALSAAWNIQLRATYLTGRRGKRLFGPVAVQISLRSAAGHGNNHGSRDSQSLIDFAKYRFH